MQRPKKSAFTLVELIVVITILAILGTIAFISLQGYSAVSRDSVRIADVGTMTTSLEVFQINAGRYPLPDQNGIFTYNGETLWTQGLFGGTVINNLSREMAKAPRDPLTDKEYTYSISGNKNEFQILNLLEGELVLNGTTQTNAAESVRTPRVSGTFNGLFVKTKSYIVPLPSIITSLDFNEDDDTAIVSGTGITSQVISGGTNIPKIGNIKSGTGGLSGLSFQPVSIVNVESDSDKATVMDAIKNAYSSSSLKDEGIYEYVLGVSGEEDLAGVFDMVILGDYEDLVAINSGSGTEAVVVEVFGEKTYVTGGTYSWTAPVGVTKVSVVAVGSGGGGGYSWSNHGGAGGGLAWGNEIEVVPGQTYTVVVGSPGGGSSTKSYGNNSSFTAGSQVLTGYGAGRGGNGSTSSSLNYGGGYNAENITSWGGGRGGNSTSTHHAGGAGGYTGAGGDGNNEAGAGGGGGSPSSYSSTYGMSAAGGVGLHGEGSNGKAGNQTSGYPAFAYGGGGGSGGQDGFAGETSNPNPYGVGYGNNLIKGGDFGGGGGGGGTSYGGGYGGKGAVRIMWGGGRSFPDNARGENTYTQPGTYTWTAPAYITTVSVVAVGSGGGGGYSRNNSGGAGGGLVRGNEIEVVPGQTYTVVVGSPGGGSSNQSYGNNSSFTASGQVLTGYGAGRGGNGSTSSNISYGGGYNAENIVNWGGGRGGNSTTTYHAGGAGGYTGAGGDGTNEAGAGGGGGSPSGYSSTYGMSAAGGVGIWGQGENGKQGNQTSSSIGSSYGGGGGSDGTDGFAGERGSFRRNGNNRMQGGYYGGGGGGGGTSYGGGYGGYGAVRIIWGDGREFPSTNTR